MEEGSEEYEQKREELMDDWRDSYFERQKRKRDDDEIAEKIERGKHIEKVVDLKDARYFTFVGSYDVDNAKFVKGPDGQCSLLMPYNNA